MSCDFKNLLSINISTFLKHPLKKVEDRIEKFCKHFPEVWDIADFTRVLRSFNVNPITFSFCDIDSVPENISLIQLQEPTGIILPDEYYAVPLNWVKFRKTSMGYEVEYLPGKFRIFPKDILSAFSREKDFGFYLDFC